METDLEFQSPIYSEIPTGCKATDFYKLHYCNCSRCDHTEEGGVGGRWRNPRVRKNHMRQLSPEDFFKCGGVQIGYRCKASVMDADGYVPQAEHLLMFLKVMGVMGVTTMLTRR